MHGLARSLYKHAVLWRAFYGPFATERILGTIPEEKGISSQFWVSGCCEGLPMVLLQLNASLELFLKRREFLPGPCFYLIAI